MVDCGLLGWLVTSSLATKGEHWQADHMEHKPEPNSETLLPPFVSPRPTSPLGPASLPNHPSSGGYHKLPISTSRPSDRRWQRGSLQGGAQPS
jgi:hypothetical protein